MTGQPAPSAQLLVYGFAPGAEFEGRPLGAIERSGRGDGSLVAPLLGFRLDPGGWRGVSEKALRADASGGPLRWLGEALEPGAAVAAMVVQHVWARTLDEAAARTGGERLASEPVDASTFDELTAELVVAVDPRDEI